MKENGFYKVSQNFIALIHNIGGTYKDAKERPVFCCFEDKYIDGEYTSQGQHLVLATKRDILAIRRKLSRILFDESRYPNKYEQHITDIKNYLLSEMEKDKAAKKAAPLHE